MKKCPKTISGKHIFQEEKVDTIDEEKSLNKNQVLLQTYAIYIPKCIACGVFDEEKTNKDIISEHKEWRGAITKVIDNRGIFSKIFESSESHVDPETGNETTEAAMDLD